MTAPSSTPAAFADLLAQAVTEPGIVSAAYSAFHTYSIGNQLLAWSQCLERALQPGPMATYPDVGGTRPARPQGREGDHVVSAGHGQAEADRRDRSRRPGDVFTRFIYRPHWFVLAQTDGQELPADADPGLGCCPGPGCAGRDRSPLRRDGRQLPGVRAGAVDRDQPGQPDAAQDAVS